MAHPSFKDETNNKYGRLLVIERAKNKRGGAIWMCLCDCGSKTLVEGFKLRSGHTKSCGCFSTESLNNHRTKHGNAKKGKETRTYLAWCAMKSRCSNKKNDRYKHYGGRGIKVCDSWMESFENFLSDMGEAPTKNHSIERNDNNGLYEKNNCRWATSIEQARNKRTNRIITYDNKTLPLIRWSEILNIKYHVLIDRLGKLNWNIDRAFTTPALDRGFEREMRK